MAKTKAKPETWLRKNDYLLRIQKWCRDGLTNAQISEKIGISATTFRRWTDMEVIPEVTDLPYRQVDFKGLFGDFLIRAREADDEIIGALKMSATGYYIEDEYVDKKGNKKVVRRWIPPSDKAQALWLKNRLPGDWNKENERRTDTTALDRLDAILGSLTQSAIEDEEQEDVEEVEAYDSDNSA